VPLCRTGEQIAQVIDAGFPEVELDWMEFGGLAQAVERARAAGLRVTIATVRVQKPGEEGYDRRIAALAPDGVLIRHWGALMHFAGKAAPRPRLHGDFSLNVTNSLTAAHLLGLGLDTLTAAHDLDQDQLFALLEASVPSRFTITVHHRIPTFHTEHCIYAHLLSQGRDYRSCGRPCEHHQISVQDLLHRIHPVMVDSSCRNTVFNAEPQSAANLVPRLLDLGVRRFRVEFVREHGAEVRRVLDGYRALLARTLTPETLLRRLGARAQQGVTAHSLALVV
jgi:putative protease